MKKYFFAAGLTVLATVPAAYGYSNKTASDVLESPSGLAPQVAIGGLEAILGTYLSTADLAKLKSLPQYAPMKALEGRATAIQIELSTLGKNHETQMGVRAHGVLMKQAAETGYWPLPNNYDQYEPISAEDRKAYEIAGEKTERDADKALAAIEEAKIAQSAELENVLKELNNQRASFLKVANLRTAKPLFIIERVGGALILADLAARVYVFSVKGVNPQFVALDKLNPEILSNVKAKLGNIK